MKNINFLLNDFKKDPSIEEFLKKLSGDYGGGLAFSTSFSLEDQVITHMIVESKINIKIFTLDTGRLFSETYDLYKRTNERYGIKIESYFPDANKLEDFINERGPNSFYSSVSDRKRCCFIRKIEPLERALKGIKIWIAGIRREHSLFRSAMTFLERDEERNLIKYHPLLDWSAAEVFDYIQQNNIPYSKLYDQGYRSVGCAPCTRPVGETEDIRAGRWWWESESSSDDKKECGLHSC